MYNQPMMSEASKWRMDLARRIAGAYAENPKVRAVMAAGSTGRGTADRYSDLEVDVYWSEAPSEADRLAAVARSGGELIGLDEDPDEWEEQIDFGGFKAATSAFLASTVERYLHETLAEYSTAENGQMRLYSLLHAVPLVGADFVAPWQARAAHYPNGLRLAMLRENLHFYGFGYAEWMYAAREDLIALYDILVRVERQIMGALLGLNGIYLPNPGFKSMDELIAEMSRKPDDLARRLKNAFRAPATAAVRELHAIIEEVFDLVAQEVPELDITGYRTLMSRSRGAWDEIPPGF